MADLFVTCKCGRRIPVSSAMAGSRVECPCGRAMLVPSLRALQAGSHVPDYIPGDAGVGAAAPSRPGDSPFAARPTPDLNPYASPQAAWEPVELQTDLPEWSLGWLLFSFQGRIPRRAYWGVTLGMTAVFMVVFLGLMAVFEEESPVLIVTLLAFYVLILWISLAIQVKRWHDRDKSGWWWLINFIPYIGGIWVLIECGCLRGTEGPNSYGPDPT